MCYGSPKHEFIILHFSIVRFQKGKNCFNVDVVHVAILEQEWHHSFIIDCKIHFYTLHRSVLLLFASVAVKCRRRLEFGFLFYESEIEFHFGKSKPPNIKHYGF